MLKRRKEAVQGILYVLPSFILISVFALIPIIMNIYFSFTKYNIMQPAQWTGLSNYIRMFKDEYVWASLANTAIFTFITVPVQTVISLVLAAIIAELFHNKFGNFVKSSLFVPVIASAVLVGTLWAIIFLRQARQTLSSKHSAARASTGSAAKTPLC